MSALAPEAQVHPGWGGVKGGHNCELEENDRPQADWRLQRDRQRGLSVKKPCWLSLLSQVPKVVSMEPGKGSRAGGTRVTVNGEHLSIGSRVR